MNTKTNTLYDSIDVAVDEFNENPKDLVSVPGHLTRAAKRKLAGEKSAQVSFNSGGLLSRFAAKLRKRAAQ